MATPQTTDVPIPAPRKRGRPRKVPMTVGPDASLTTAAEIAAGDPRRRGSSPKVREPEFDFVEWWKPGWEEKYR